MNWTEIWHRIAPHQIIIYADFIDPFCYIGFHNARLAARNAGISLSWRGFELNADTPEGGALLQAANNSDLRPGMWSSVQDFAKKSGLQLAEPAMVPNTHLALLWVQSVRDSDVKNSLIERIYQAYLSDKKNVGDPDVLLGIADEFGLPAGPIHELAGRSGASELDGYRQEAMKRGFPGMPGFVYKGKTLFGALSQDAWRDIFEGRTAGRS